MLDTGRCYDLHFLRGAVQWLLHLPRGTIRYLLSPSCACYTFFAAPKECDQKFVEDEQVALLFDEGQDGVNRVEWKSAMEADNELQNVLTYVCSGWPNKTILSQSERSFWEVRNELSEEQNILLSFLLVENDRRRQHCEKRYCAASTVGYELLLTSCWCSAGSEEAGATDLCTVERRPRPPPPRQLQTSQSRFPASSLLLQYPGSPGPDCQRRRTKSSCPASVAAPAAARRTAKML
ncbi:hypothetical protein NDU88_002206 [Pleurodeles waltl]|uniref:Uncharacterized protein n=1 Tax=Pleurodeles waltl TaxID=8319 RepID=A0AAV7V9X2_PLEWA|nr:hypothetical protein NDU88_002206 [Pleurodeles waltl]